MSNRSKLLTWGLPLVGLSTLLMGAGMVVQNRPVVREESPPRPPTTQPRHAATSADAPFIGAIGTSEPPGETIAIAAHTAGIVSRVDVAVGDTVESGHPLFTVDTAKARAELALRQSRLELAERELAALRATIPPRRAAVDAAQAVLAAARADLLATEIELADEQNLLNIADAVADPRAIAREEVDRRRFAVRQAEARVETARAQIEQARAGVAEAQAELTRFVDTSTDADGPEIAAAVSRVAEARAAIRQSQTDLDLLTARSPINARVLQVNIRPGEFAPASVPTEGLIVLGALGPTHIRVEIDEVDIPRFSKQSNAWASPRGDADRRIPLRIVNIEPLVVPKRNLAGRTSELIDTRVLQVVYAIDADFESPGIGQQFDVFIEAPGGES